mgnify:CR=1 FL=1
MTASAGDSTDARPRLRRSQRERTSWLQVRGVIMSRIAEGIYPPGELIPTEIELASEFGCARATVNRALAAQSLQRVFRPQPVPARFAASIRAMWPA